MPEQRTAAVSIVIVCWESAAYLPRCLQSLESQSYSDFEVIVVDNASTDGATDELARRHPALKLRLERLNSNRGFAIANNVAARLAQGEWLVLLNPDAYPEPDWLDELMKAAAAHPAAFFASRQLQADRPGVLDGEGDEYHTSGLAWRAGYGQPILPAGEVREVFSACAAAAMFPRLAFLDAGGFDEDYFAYHEDVDLGFRLRLRGLKCMLAPAAVVHHVGYGSSGRRSRIATYYGHRNLVWTYVKDMPTQWFWLYLPLHLLMNGVALVYFTLRLQGTAIWRAKIEALRGLPLALRKRAAIQRQVRVSASEIRRMMTRSLIAPWQQLLTGRDPMLH
jgi:GT2 family glycosyltransferase